MPYELIIRQLGEEPTSGSLQTPADVSAWAKDNIIHQSRHAVLDVAKIVTIAYGSKIGRPRKGSAKASAA
jgi:hypothetical protein